MGEISSRRERYVNSIQRLVGRPQDKSISLIQDVTPRRLVNILRYVTSKNGATFLLTAVTNIRRWVHKFPA